MSSGLLQKLCPVDTEAPLEWTVQFIRKANIGSYCMFSAFFFLGSVMAYANGWNGMPVAYAIAGIAMGSLAYVTKESYFSVSTLQALMIFAYVCGVALAYVGLLCASSSVFIHRSCGFLAATWRFWLPYHCLNKRMSLVGLIVITMCELVLTQAILWSLGPQEEAQANRVLATLSFQSCLTPIWIYFNCSLWYVLWSSQMQLASEKESSKSLLSMVCDATCWLSPEGDTILQSSRQCDALLGQEAEGSLLSHHVPQTEVERIQTALSACEKLQLVRLLPTSIVRDRNLVTNVDMFIVPCRSVASGSGYGFQRSDPVEMLGRLVGFRVAQTSESIDSSEIRAAPSRERNVGEVTFSQTSDIFNVNEDGGGRFRGLRYRRKVRGTFENESQDGGDSSVSSISASTGSHIRRPRGILKASEHSPGVGSVCRPYSAPFTLSSSYLKECVMSTLEDLLSACNYERYGCCAWHSSTTQLSFFLDEMQHWYTCVDAWPAQENCWQCNNCSAIVSPSLATEYCWLCGKEAAIAEESNV